MIRNFGVALAFCACLLVSCAKKQGEGQGQAAAQPALQSSAQPAATAGGPHAVVHLNDGGTVPGSIVASSATDVTVAGDDGIERKIPLQKVKSVEYGDAQPAAAPPPVQRAARSPRTGAPPPQSAPQAPPPAPPRQEAPPQQAQAPAPAPPPPPPAPVARTYEVPAGTEISVRTNEAIDSGVAKEGQTFSADVTRDAKDAGGRVVIPRGSPARILIKSASKGSRFHGASDLVVDLDSVAINGQSYAVETAAIAQKGKAGIGANKRTAEYTGGAAALGAIIGAIAGGGKGAGIGAGAGAGAGALTQILTKGGAIRIPVETVLTFRLDQPLRVTALE